MITENDDNRLREALGSACNEIWKSSLIRTEKDIDRINSIISKLLNMDFNVSKQKSIEMKWKFEQILRCYENIREETVKRMAKYD